MNTDYQNPMDRIESYYDQLTKTDRDLAVYIMNNPVQAARSTIEELAKLAKVSPSAVTRFCKKTGFSSYANFKFDMSRFLVSQNDTIRQDDQKASPATAIAQAYADSILHIPQMCQEKDIKKAADLILHAEHVKFFGYNRTFHAASQLEQRLSRLGYDASAVGDVISMRDLSYILGDKDCVVIFTIKDHEHIYESICKTLYERNCPLVIITMMDGLALRKQAEVYTVLPRISQDSGISFLDDQAIFFVYIEILLDCIAHEVRS